MEGVGFLMTRGVVIDVAGYKGVAMLDAGFEITAADLEGALTRQKVKLQPGDAVLIHTGWGKLWGVDNARYAKGSPGIGVGAAEWLAKQDPMLVGADNGGVEVQPNPDARVNLPVHQILLVVHGVHLLENLRLDAIVTAGAWESAFMMQALKIEGGTGSTVAPVALR
jgi:kynurenine formamidase